jgi:thymidylate synthase (FAD)
MTALAQVLDLGYVELVETWGSDERIIEAARQSVGGGFVSWDAYGGHPKGDAGLLRYLYEHKHSTPFEMAGAVFEVKAPIFVFREWHRHRTQSYSEASARYAPLPDENYVPSIGRLMLSSNTNGQAGSAKGADELTRDSAEAFQNALKATYAAAEGVYQLALKRGVPKELARLVLPVGRYSRMRASANLRNWLGFLTLRLDSNAQFEIRQYAHAVDAMLCRCFPRTMQLFAEGMR